MHVAVLFDGSTVAEWQKQALDALSRDHRISFLIAHDEKFQHTAKKLKHAFYYGLRVTSMRNRLTKRVRLATFGGASVKTFIPEWDGAWAVLPDDVIAWLRDTHVDAVVKFGLNLLRIPEGIPPVISYHHGDPRSFRGRPAGFYEMCKGEPFMGQIVQILSNRLDAGSVIAFTQTNVHPHSYRKTLRDAYAASPPLLPRALAALQAGETLPIEPTGPNYRLPGNATVARMMLRSGQRLAERLFYGAFVEKRWKVSTAVFAWSGTPQGLGAELEARRRTWHTLPILPGYTFYADPFFHRGSDDILVEALNARSGRGEVVRVTRETQRALAGTEGGHVSYPHTVVEQGIAYVVPEMSERGSPAIFVIEDGRLQQTGLLDIDADGLIDPTFFRHDGRLYLFANRTGDEGQRLHLWSATGLFDQFHLHPASPICVGGRGSRMAGHVERFGTAIYRFGQDHRKQYGDGVIAFRIDRLDDESYGETPVADIAFRDVRGPHTINRDGDTWLFDWYVERLSPLAGVRRLLGRLGPLGLAARAGDSLC